MATAELTTSSNTSTATLQEQEEGGRGEGGEVAVEVGNLQGETCRPVRPRPNPIAALIRKGAEEAGRLQRGSRATTKVQRMINSLQWRQVR